MIPSSIPDPPNRVHGSDTKESKVARKDGRASATPKALSFGDLTIDSKKRKRPGPKGVGVTKHKKPRRSGRRSVVPSDTEESSSSDSSSALILILSLIPATAIQALPTMTLPNLLPVKTPQNKP
jgi:hypothetical protein